MLYCEDQVMDDMVTFIEGFHTAAQYATWTFYYLAQHLDTSPREADQRSQRESSGHSQLDEYGEKLKAYTLTSRSFDASS